MFLYKCPSDEPIYTHFDMLSFQTQSGLLFDISITPLLGKGGEYNLLWQKYHLLSWVRISAALNCRIVCDYKLKQG